MYPDPTDAPKITSSTIKLGTPVTVTEGLQVSVDITSSDKNGLTGLVVDIESPTLTPDELAGMGLAAHLDLVNPGDLKSMFLYSVSYYSVTSINVSVVVPCASVAFMIKL